jgi:adenosylmethionine-8-amino-7-oxononanoate aminotransferase
VEPLIQGAAGMIPHPQGWLRQVTDIARAHGALLIADEVMTAFGRAGTESSAPGTAHRKKSGRQADKGPDSQGGSEGVTFACHQEGVQPDFLAVAKGLTGGYLPMAATLTTAGVFEMFLGEYEEFKTFFHGHSYTGNQLGAAAARASLSLLQSRASWQARMRLERTLRQTLPVLWRLPQVGDVRQVGLIVGVELVKDWPTRQPFGLEEQAGLRVCEAMRRRGVLTRPIGNVLVLMPPFCTTPAQAQQLVEVTRQSIAETF